MMKISKIAMLLLACSALGTFGCAAGMPPEDGDDLDQESVGEDGFAEESDGEVLGESQDLLLNGQTMIQASSELCWNARSSSVLNLVKCDDKSATQSFVIEPNTFLIRSAYYWGRCAEIPKTLTGTITLQACDQWDSYQWFPFVPAFDGQGKICGFVKDPAGVTRCASHKGTTSVYTETAPGAPPWYRLDF